MNNNPLGVSSSLLLLSGIHIQELVSKIQNLKNTFGGAKSLVLLPPGMSNVFATKPGFSTRIRDSSAQNPLVYHKKKITESAYKHCASECA